MCISPITSISQRCIGFSLQSCRCRILQRHAAPCSRRPIVGVDLSRERALAAREEYHIRVGYNDAGFSPTAGNWGTLQDLHSTSRYNTTAPILTEDARVAWPYELKLVESFACLIFEFRYLLRHHYYLSVIVIAHNFSRQRVLAGLASVISTSSENCLIQLSLYPWLSCPH